MLVLKRRRGERIKIGADITLVVAEIDGKNVRIGIDAPRSVRILRQARPAAKAGPGPRSRR